MEIKEYTEYNEKEIARLYTEVGWTAYTDNLPILRRGFENSLLVLAAFENNELIGIVRVVGDGFTIVFVQDILVFPHQQRKGVGTALLQAILERYKNVQELSWQQTTLHRQSLFINQWVLANSLNLVVVDL